MIFLDTGIALAKPSSAPLVSLGRQSQVGHVDSALNFQPCFTVVTMTHIEVEERHWKGLEVA